MKDITHLATVLVSSPLSHFNPVNTNPQTTFPVPRSGGPPINHSFSATFTKNTPKNCKNTPPPAALTQQLVVPLSIGTWKGKAIVDTGASYTLLHENLCLELIAQSLLPWTRGPLYLANGEAEIPLGWVNAPITLHNKVFKIPAAVLPAKALAYAVVLAMTRRRVKTPHMTTTEHLNIMKQMHIDRSSSICSEKCK